MSPRANYRLFSRGIVVATMLDLTGCTGATGPRDGGVADTSACGPCDDTVPCTEDRCDGDRCVHVPRNSFCGMSGVCDPTLGCRSTRVCASSADCRDTDPCTVEETCNMASRTCTFSILDGDHDGHPAQACGGDDCNDDQALAYPGAAEACNGLDDDCDGTIDNGSRLCEENATCSGTGGCVCNGGARQCRSGCVSTAALQSDPRNCGACDVQCARGQVCRAGRCGCEDPNATTCSSGCVDLRTNQFNCGACSVRCDGTCRDGTCMCPAGTTHCPREFGQSCVDLQNDRENCGRCGVHCSPALSMFEGGEICVRGVCTPCPAGTLLCGTQCIDRRWDNDNCGGCGVSCRGRSPENVCTDRYCIPCGTRGAPCCEGAQCREGTCPGPQPGHSCR